MGSIYQVVKIKEDGTEKVLNEETDKEKAKEYISVMQNNFPTSTFRIKEKKILMESE